MDSDLRVLADCIGYTIVGVHKENDWDTTVKLVLDPGDPAHPDRVLTIHGFGMYDDGGLNWEIKDVNL